MEPERGDIFGPGSVIDDIVPDPVSNAAAGFLDGWSNGMASHAFGIQQWCNAPGYDIGNKLSYIGWRGLAKGLLKLGIKDAIRAFARHEERHAFPKIRVGKDGKVIPPKKPPYKPSIGDARQSQDRARSRIQRQHDQAPGARRPGERPK